MEDSTHDDAGYFLLYSDAAYVVERRAPCRIRCIAAKREDYMGKRKGAPLAYEAHRKSKFIKNL